MSEKREVITGFVSVIIIFLAMFGGGIYVITDPFLKEAVSFSNAAMSVAAQYPLPYIHKAAFENAEDGLFSMLDPFSFRIPESDYAFIQEESSGEYGGIGITIAPRDTALMVISVREGGPAYEGGIQSGDFIIKVNGYHIPAEDPSSITDSIRGPSGSNVEITVYRPAIDDTIHLILQRSNIKLDHIPYSGLNDDNIGYIRLADFEAGAAEELAAAVEELEKQDPEGYILDLKGNPGGYLNEAIDAADIFLPDGALIVGTTGRSRWENRRLYSRHDPLTDRPIVVITDRGTASAAEILTGAISGADRGVVIGDTTFGKGLVQTVYRLANNDAIRLTTSRYYFADGRFLNPPDSELTFTGLAPDLVVSDKGEMAFKSMILSGFLLYDFVEKYNDYLQSIPPPFALPDSVITLFEGFALQRHNEYDSYLTNMLSMTVKLQRINHSSPIVMHELDQMLAKSKQLDKNVFRRHSEFLKYNIKRVFLEKIHGAASAYREAIVPGRRDINIASEILINPEHYRALLESNKSVAEAAPPDSQ